MSVTSLPPGPVLRRMRRVILARVLNGGHAEHHLHETDT